MDQVELKESIHSILDESFFGAMATVNENKPNARYMTFFHDDLTLYTITNEETHKVEELKENPHTHILLGFEGEGFGDDYVEYEGVVETSEDKSLIEKLWSDKMSHWFDGPEDDRIVILKIKPECIRLMNKKGEAPKSLKI